MVEESGYPSRPLTQSEQDQHLVYGQQWDQWREQVCNFLWIQLSMMLIVSSSYASSILDRVCEMQKWFPIVRTSEVCFQFDRYMHGRDTMPTAMPVMPCFCHKCLWNTIDKVRGNDCTMSPTWMSNVIRFPQEFKNTISRGTVYSTAISSLTFVRKHNYTIVSSND